MLPELQQLAQEWIVAKEAEKKAIDHRRTIEDRLFFDLDLKDDMEGTETYKVGGYSIKVVGRLTRKVDGDMLQDIAAEHGMLPHLSSLFRWKPEVNMSVWNKTAANITSTLAQAITTTPGRPSFTITTKDQSASLPTTTKE